MTATYQPQPHIELAKLSWTFRISKSPIQIVSNWAERQLLRLLDNGILVMIGFKQQIELQVSPESARTSFKSFENNAKLLHARIQQLQNLDTFDLVTKRLVAFDKACRDALLTLKAIALLDQGPIAISQADFEVQDEVMRIAALRTQPEYWEDPDRKLWLEAVLN